MRCRAIHSATVTGSEPTRTVKAWQLIASLSLAGTLAALQQTLVVPQLPIIPQILGVSIDDATWLITVTLLAGAIATPILSRLADMYGKKRIFLVTIGLMAAGSILGAIGGLNYWPVLVGRALQGLAAAAIPIGISIMRDHLPLQQLPGAIAIMSATMGVGAGLGLPLSGVLYDSFGWSSLFVTTAAVSVLVIIATAWFVHESKDIPGGRFDLTGAVLLAVALGSFLLALSKGASWGWGTPLTLGLFAVAAVTAVVWFRYQLRTESPLLDLRSASRPPILLTNLASVLIGFSMFINMLVTTQQLQQPPESGAGLGLPVVLAGLAMMPSAFMMLIMSPLSGRIINRFGARLALVAGAAIMSLSYLLRVFFHDTVLLVILGSAAVGIGTALAFAAMPAIIMANAGRHETAAANGLNALMRTIGTSLSSAVTGAILASFTVLLGENVYASSEAFRIVLFGASAAALLGALLAWAVPRRNNV